MGQPIPWIKEVCRLMSRFLRIVSYTKRELGMGGGNGTYITTAIAHNAPFALL
jgi:hypothetical protein